MKDEEEGEFRSSDNNVRPREKQKLLRQSYGNNQLHSNKNER
jgi:hypothetical protein